jgi:transcriptional regulator with XRE-family HTH domain
MYPNLKLQLWKTAIRQNRLAQMLGMDETALSKIVNGFREPNADVRGRIASMLGSDEKWLFESVEPASDIAPQARANTATE